MEDARRLLLSGADKIVVNTPLFDNTDLVRKLVNEFGQQCIVGSVDMKRGDDSIYQIFTESGSRVVLGCNLRGFDWLRDQLVGELYLNSINQDGTGQGYDFGILDQLPSDCNIPVILAGGVGNRGHFVDGFDDPRVDAVATAHLFNFVGDGLKRVREKMLEEGKMLALWPSLEKLPIKLSGTMDHKDD